MAVAMAVAIGLVGALGLSPWRTGAVAQTQETQTQEGQTQEGQTVEGAGAGQSAPPAKAGDEARPQGDDADTGPVPAIGPAADAGQVLRALGRLPFGETLQYRGRVEKAGIVFEAGRANLRVLLDESGRPNLEARAFGEKFGYILKTRILTVLDPVDFRPIEHQSSEQGTERRHKTLRFREDGADFLRLKHCRDKECEDPTHRVKQPKMHGPIPWGTELVHCDDRDCTSRGHYAWRTRTEHRFEDSYVDLLSAIYLAREADLEPGAEPLVIPVISDTRRWKVRVRSLARKRLTVAAGEFDAVQLVLEPLIDDDAEKTERFEGLFGLNGAIRIWVDVEDRRPILIEGNLPFAFLDLKAKIELEKISVDEELALRGAERFEERAVGIEKVSATEPDEE